MRREILLAFWKVHVLHHASRHPIYGQWMLRELRRHGFDLSPGTLYPLLERMAGHGWLRPRSPARPRARNARREYVLTASGARELEELRRSVRELYRELAREPAVGPGRAPERVPGAARREPRGAGARRGER